MKKKYVIWAGTVDNIEGKREWVDCDKLCELYGVNPKECLMVHDIHDDLDKYSIKLIERCIHLYPRNDGNYKVPKTQAKGLV